MMPALVSNASDSPAPPPPAATAGEGSPPVVEVPPAETSSVAPAPSESESALSAIQRILPGHYKAPMSVRAAATFARVSTSGSILGGLGERRAASRVNVVALIALALLAAGGVGMGLAFRYGGAKGRGAAPPASVAPLAEPAKVDAVDASRP